MNYFLLMMSDIQ